MTERPRNDVRRAIADDPALSARQKATLLDVYDSFVGDRDPAGHQDQHEDHQEDPTTSQRPTGR